jgi:5-methyltetrahydrofolate--homocysteine methyltransferase
MIFETATEGVLVIGNRINARARSVRPDEIRRGDTGRLILEAGRQLEAGAQALDVNLGKSAADSDLMRLAVSCLENRFGVPLAVDSPIPEVLLAGLEEAHGKAILNSVSAAEKPMRLLLPAAARREIVVIGLAMGNQGLPGTWKERLANAQKIVLGAFAEGVSLENLVMDTVLLPVRFYPDQIFETLTALKAVKDEYGVKTCLGISNVSFGLAERGPANAAFLELAVAFGLDIAIADPLDRSLMDTAKSGRKEKPARDRVEHFVENYAAHG